MAVHLVPTGRTALAAGLLMTAGVEGEWLLNPQRDDGTLTSVPLFAVLLLVSLAGFVLLVVAASGLRRAMVSRTRPARVGAAMTVAGAGLLALFAAAVLVTGVVDGEPAGLAFVPFLLGMLLLAVGPVTWGLSLRRRPPAPGVAPALVVSGVAAFAALALEPDPWHDLSLVVMFGAWSAIGLLVMRGPRGTGLPVRTADAAGRRH
ncbi:hypothetical protein FHP29_11950 [Nocardioides albidus]|uniref:DUF998 domain-containing protein n=1 Tax=Nocardioides albidus TaxID=1517589 RepID=A0A5C4VVN2_9ACTN|nr:hypothetical protein [Nocardioides albidus]TNM39586.1 hypothetical protein FHP29_11950 [Nocardioides albidus]